MQVQSSIIWYLVFFFLVWMLVLVLVLVGWLGEMLSENSIMQNKIRAYVPFEPLHSNENKNHLHHRNSQIVQMYYHNLVHFHTKQEIKWNFTIQMEKIQISGQFSFFFTKKKNQRVNQLDVIESKFNLCGPLNILFKSWN